MEPGCSSARGAQDLCGISEVSFLPVWFGLVLLVWTCWRKASPIPNLSNLVKQCEVLLPSAGFFSLVPGRPGFISGSFQDSGSLKEPVMP